MSYGTVLAIEPAVLEHPRLRKVASRDKVFFSIFLDGESCARLLSYFQAEYSIDDFGRYHSRHSDVPLSSVAAGFRVRG